MANRVAASVFSSAMAALVIVSAPASAQEITGRVTMEAVASASVTSDAIEVVWQGGANIGDHRIAERRQFIDVANAE